MEADHGSGPEKAPSPLPLAAAPSFHTSGMSYAMPFRMEEDASTVKYIGDDDFRRDILRPTTGRTVLSRVSTAASRPSTAGLQEFNVVVLVENRTREIGFAICNLASMHAIQLYQLFDNQSYTQTMALLQLLSPVEIVICKSQGDRPLQQKIIDAWGNKPGGTTQIASVARKYVTHMPQGARHYTCEHVQCLMQAFR